MHMETIHLKGACSKNLSFHACCTLRGVLGGSATKTHRGDLWVRLYFELAAEPGIIHTVLIGKMKQLQRQWNLVSRSQEATEAGYLGLPTNSPSFFIMCRIVTYVTAFFSVKLLGPSVSFEFSCHSFAILSLGYILSVAMAIRRKQLNWHSVASSNSASTSRVYKNFDSLSLC